MTDSTAKFQTAIDAYISHIKNDYAAWNQRCGLEKRVDMEVWAESGHKFVKIVKRTYGQTSVHSFIARENTRWGLGAVLKSASWRAPAQNFTRGNIFDKASYEKRVTWTGAA